MIAEISDSTPLIYLIGGMPLVNPCTVANNGMCFQTPSALIDTGANGSLFVDTKLADLMIDKLGCEWRSDFKPYGVGTFEDGTSQHITRLVKGHFRIQGYLFPDEWMMVITMRHPIIVGRKWLDYHDMLVDTRRRRLLPPPELLKARPDTDIPIDQTGQLICHPRFDADVDRRDRLMDEEDRRRRSGRMSPQGEVRTGPVGPMTERPPLILPTQVLLRKGKTAHVCDPTVRAHQQMERQLALGDEGVTPPPVPKPGPRPRKPPIEEFPLRDAQGAYRLQRGFAWYKERPPDIAIIAAAPFMTLARKYEDIGVTSLCEINHYIQDKINQAKGMENDEVDLQEKVLREVPAEYHDYLDIFSKSQSDELPPMRTTANHKIDLVDDAKPEDLGYSPLYKMSLEELTACKKYIEEHLKKGFIESSNAPWAAPILFARKHDGGLRFCVDYRKLNAITKKDRYPLPLIEETLARISKAKFFTKIDIRQAFHRVRITPGDEDLTTFRTRYGAYRYKVLPFGLTNGPSTFQRFINETMMGYLDDFCSAYIDDILIFSDTLEEHHDHVKKVLQRLRDAGLQADIKKCEFHVRETKYLGFIVGVNGVAVDPEKISVVRDWEEPTTVRGVQSFLGFCNFYRKFVRNYGRIAKPLNNLTKKGEAYLWTDDCQIAFDDLKQALLTAPILRHFSFDADVETKVDTDSSDGVVAGALLQRREGEEDWHPVAFYSETMQGAEHNYPIHDKELMAVVRALICWRAELIGLPRPFTVITDNQALEFFSTKRLLNLRQAGWAEIMAQYHFTITYRPGKENVLADALSRKSEEVRTQKEKKEIQRTMRIFRPVQELDPSPRDPSQATICELDLAINTSDKTGCAIMLVDEATNPDSILLVDEILQQNQEDPALELYREKARAGDPRFTMLDDRLLLYEGRMVVADKEHLRTRIIRETHDRMTTAHPGRNKTRALVMSRYWWTGLATDVDRYIANCITCRPSKVPRDKTPGLLQPLPVVEQPWRDLVMDFKKMPESKKGHNNLMVMMDRLSKTSYSIPTRDTVTAAQSARHYYEGPYRIFGLPRSVVSDRGPQFVSGFRQELCKILNINWKLSTSGHSQTAGQVEIMNEYIDQRLRLYVNHYQDDWDDMIPALDAVQASLPHESLGGMQPHEVLFGYPMPMHIDWTERTTNWTDIVPKDKLSREEAQEHVKTLLRYTEAAQSAIQKAQERMIRQANKTRRTPDFDIGDRVFIIKKKGWATTRPSDKLDYPMTRVPYEIVSKVKDNVFKLKVPTGWRATDQFNAERLRRYPDNPLPGQANDNPDGEVLDGEEEWEVERITASRLHHRKLQYQAQWKGWDPDPTWYDAQGFKNATAQIRRYHDEHPGQDGPPARLEQWERAALNDEFDPPHPDDDKAASTRRGARTRQRRG
jgi:hypothetical protein